MDARLRHAVAVARHASFFRAAEAVGVTQSAVTKSVADLERQIGCAIFVRTSRGATPTEEGRDFLDRAARVLADTSDLLSNRRGITDPMGGILRVGIYPGSLDWVLSAGLTELVRRYPTVRLHVFSGTVERGLKLLTRGDIDIACGLEEAFKRWSDVSCTKVGDVEMQCFVRRRHPLLSREGITLDDKLEFGFVSPSMSAPYADTVQAVYRSRSLDAASSMHIVDFFPLAKSIVARSNAIGLIATTMPRGDNFDEEFVVIDDPLDIPQFSVGLAVRTNWPVKPAAKELISLLPAHMPKRSTDFRPPALV